MSLRTFRPTVVALWAVSAVLLSGADWPGRTREIAAGFDTATPARRREILLAYTATDDTAGVALILHALDDSEPTVRIAAAEVAAQSGLSAAIAPLGTWLSDTRPDLRAAAARALGVLGATAQLPSLVRALGDADVTVRLCAVEAVSALDSPDAPLALLDRLTDPEAAVRVAAAQALGNAGDPRASLSLLGALQDPLPEVRQSAANALGQLGDPRAVRALRSLLHDPVAEVRLGAARAIGTLGPAGAPAVADLAAIALREDPAGDPGARGPLVRAAVESLGRIGGTDATGVLVQVFRTSDIDPDTARAAAAALVRLGDLSRARVPSLCAAPVSVLLLGPLIELLGDLGGDAAATSLTSLLDTPSLPAGLHDAALRALGRTGASAAVVTLLSAAATPAAREVPFPRAGQRARWAGGDPVTAALAGLRAWVVHRGSLDPAALDPLADLLRAPPATGTPLTAQAAELAYLVGATHNHRASAVLAPLLSSDRSELRRLAAEGLSHTGIDGVEAPVAAALSDPLPEVRLAAADALARRGGTSALAAVVRRWQSADPVDRTSAARALGRITLRTGELTAVPLLVEAVRHGSISEAAAALDALADAAAAGDSRAREALVTSLDTPSLATVAAEALANAAREAPPGYRTALAAPLARLLQGHGSTALRAAAAWGLAGAGAGAIPPLVTALGDPSTPVAANAAASLATLAGSVPTAVAVAREPLCAALAQRVHPLVRANLFLATARAGVVCDPLAARHALLGGRSPWVRAAAAEAVGLALRTTGDATLARPLRASLSRCATADAVRAVAARCIAVTAPALGTPPVDNTADDTVDVVVTGDDGVAAVGTTYGLVLPDGVARVGVTGPDGWVHVRGVPPGMFAVVDPDALPLER